MRHIRQIPVYALALVAAVTPAAAQERAWIDVNLGMAKAGRTGYPDAVSFPYREEMATVGATYRLPAGAGLDFGAGWMVHRRWGIGVSMAGTAHEDTAELSATIPHPAFFNAHVTDTTATDSEFRRLERSVNIQGVALLTQPGTAFSIRVFGGPSRFRVKQDVVRDLVFVESLQGTAYFVDIVNADRVPDTEGHGWGFHAGADARYFFTDRVGVGVMLRLNRGEVEIPGMFGETTEVKTGGLQVGAGLRLRF